jgi:hypothetical protein
MKILKHGKYYQGNEIAATHEQAICKHCGCEFCYTYKDIAPKCSHVNDSCDATSVLRCPECGFIVKQIILRPYISYQSINF